ncbi:hypothetical protein JM83_3425 [Gillisia sp. Hel_I_86]|nr:hypothetical protein JM83_3425 [Gillisia sp. Hel_I_86]
MFTYVVLIMKEGMSNMNVTVGNEVAGTIFELVSSRLWIQGFEL